MTCDICNENAYRIRAIGNGVFSCFPCLRKQPEPDQLVNIGSPRFFLKGYGLVSENEIKEVKSRVMLDLDPVKATYRLGRVNRYGKLEEKCPTYGDYD